MASSETLVFGHRGAMARAPMNTRAAFALAAAEGAAGIELDVQLSKDGQPVIVHDYSVDATTDGKGAVADLTLAELKTLDAGAWFSSSFIGERIPTLDEVFAEFGRALFINVEIKSAAGDGGEISALVANCIRRHSMVDRVIVSSFNPMVLRRFSALHPDVMLGFLCVPGLSDEAEALMRDLPHDARHPWHEAVDAEYMSWAAEQGYVVNAWTVNEPGRARELKALGISAVISDDPAGIISALE